ncbi:MAG: hypothetical protein JWP29_1947 [Rhodoferax sp.]|nr:hypothetical protein [Rhodoferax sp.]
MPWPKGKPRSPDTVAKMSKALAGRRPSPQAFAAQAAAWHITWDDEMVSVAIAGAEAGASHYSTSRRLGVSETALANFYEKRGVPDGRRLR